MENENLIVFFAVTGGLFLLYLALGESVVDRLFFASDAPEQVEAENEAWHYIDGLIEPKTDIHSYDNAPLLKADSGAKTTKIGGIRI